MTSMRGSQTFGRFPQQGDAAASARLPAINGKHQVVAADPVEWAAAVEAHAREHGRLFLGALKKPSCDHFERYCLFAGQRSPSPQQLLPRERRTFAPNVPKTWSETP